MPKKRDPNILYEQSEGKKARGRAVDELGKSKRAKEGLDVASPSSARGTAARLIHGSDALINKAPNMKKAKEHADKAYKAAKEAQRLKKRDSKAYEEGYYSE